MGIFDVIWMRTQKQHVVAYLFSLPALQANFRQHFSACTPTFKIENG